MLSSFVAMALVMLSPQAEKMDGSYKVAAMEIDGNKVPAGEVGKFELTMAGSSYTVKNDGQKIDKGVLTINAKAKPMIMDAKSEEGPTQGQTMQGIYEKTADGFRVCFAPNGKPRPSQLSSKPGSGHILITYKKN